MTRRFWARDGVIGVKKLFVGLAALLLAALMSACGIKSDLIDMSSRIVDTGVTEVRAVVCEDRVYVPFCVVSKSDCGDQIGYVDGDEDARVSECKGYPVEEWLVSWIPTDGGAMLMKEESVTEIPDGLEAEYQ